MAAVELYNTSETKEKISMELSFKELTPFSHDIPKIGEGIKLLREPVGISGLTFVFLKWKKKIIPRAKPCTAGIIYLCWNLDGFV